MELAYGKKVLKSRIKSNSPHWELFFTEGGELPPSLAGLFTSETEANQAAIRFIASQAGKTRNGRTSKAPQ